MCRGHLLLMASKYAMLLDDDDFEKAGSIVLESRRRAALRKTWREILGSRLRFSRWDPWQDWRVRALQ